MSDGKADLGKLDNAISSLNEDAESMHVLITRSTDELEQAVGEAKRVADLADGAINTLKPLGEELKETIADAKGLLAETNGAADRLAADLAQAQADGKEAFEAFATDSNNAAEKTRDSLQSDLLNHKTAMASRMDSLEATITRRMDDLEGAIERLGESVKKTESSLGEKVDLLQKKVALPLYAVIAVVVLQLATLAVLLLR